MSWRIFLCHSTGGKKSLLASGFPKGWSSVLWDGTNRLFKRSETLQLFKTSDKASSLPSSCVSSFGFMLTFNPFLSINGFGPQPWASPLLVACLSPFWACQGPATDSAGLGLQVREEDRAYHGVNDEAAACAAEVVTKPCLLYIAGQYSAEVGHCEVKRLLLLLCGMYTK